MLAVLLGALLELELVWALADITNGLMALPNLLALVLLSPWSSAWSAHRARARWHLPSRNHVS